MACGALLYDDGLLQNMGRVRVFELVADKWVLMGEPLLGSAEQDNFGTSVALSADGLTLIVGAQDSGGAASPGNVANVGGGGASPGYVHILRFDGTNWIQMGGELEGEIPGDRRGTELSITEPMGWIQV